MKRMKIKDIKTAFEKKEIKFGQELIVKGWIRTCRDQKNFSFIEINDGSSLSNLQVIVDASVPGYAQLFDQLTTGSAIAVFGPLQKSPGAKQPFELLANKIEILGPCEGESYPLQKKRHSFEFLRTIAHLRPRTNAIGAIMRLRNVLAFGTHEFFQNRGFIYLHSPIITTSDCEGAGQLFRVTTLEKEIPDKQGNIDHSHDFFGSKAFLTVSGQLNAEAYACALSDVYTFGPTFRAENSNTSRHLAEFWMIEPEMAFADLNDLAELAESYLKFLFSKALKECPEEMELFDAHICKGAIERLQKIIETPFKRITYTEAVDILEKSGETFEFSYHWGCDLQSEHERYLCEKVFNGPVVLTDFPSEIKAFYMRENEDKKTCAAMDILVPGVGEIIGGSQREERLDLLEEKMDRLDLDKKAYSWYLDLRRYGTVPHGGFGAGFERLVQFVSGMENIRDVIPFPRTPKNALF